ncbi:ImmA/IrrE family metallo-endopeptidase [Methylocystis parvus]|uniref:ImmA/IrrE family metallo-endopeptidase n=1 Tax=Methylocystis parvus TaxID=134 RepID=A0A6B8M5L8_9HYPH|nr:ImmA/IrrE family metallo-endopeptidase [Methylocystis parvus]QGM97696.1 ImmA/IrrE family metallo-endopeptidase [Methylocystis parvus]WBJ98369.1 ImmA/IrrE family metallo-endopeptidase [Methylocystis parvus OBBP]
MSGTDFIVPARSWDEIGRITNRVREQFNLSLAPVFPVVDFIERVLDHHLGVLQFEVGDRTEMGNAEGLTDPSGEFLELREDVYYAALAGDGRAMFTAAHELGHFWLHRNVALARVSPAEEVKPFRRSEPQANQFAAELLMPRGFFRSSDTEQTVVDRHGVSYDAARNRLKFLRSRGMI